MAPKDVSYNVPDVLQGNDTGIYEDQIEIQYPPPGLTQEEIDQEIDDLVSFSLHFNGK